MISTQLWAGFGASLAAMVVIDSIFLMTVMRKLFERHVPALLADSPNYVAAALFYLLYAVGVTYLVVRPALAEGWSLGAVIGTAMVLGVFAYGTFELTSMAVMKGWQWSMVAADMAWGAVLTATVATLGVLAARAMG